MSEVRVGIIAEGKHDFPIIEKILSISFPAQRFIFISIQPTIENLEGSSVNPHGFGWPGVYHACKNLPGRLAIQNVLEIPFDIIIIHIDADVMYTCYESGNISEHHGDLPCFDNSLSIPENCEVFRRIVVSWFDSGLPLHTALCIPYINTDIWVAHVMFPQLRETFIENMQKSSLESTLVSMPQKDRILRIKAGKPTKIASKYIEAADALEIALWNSMCEVFSQAQLFKYAITELC